jgi:hypothetical protein
VIALAHGWIYIVHQRPDWDVSWTDQGGYKMLAHGIATSGNFTRYPGVEPFVPEAIRTPGYPGFVAVVYLIAGESHLAVAVAQILVFAAICAVVYALSRRVLPEPWRTDRRRPRGTCRRSHFAALVLTELGDVRLVDRGSGNMVATARVAWSRSRACCLASSHLRPVWLLAPFSPASALLMFCAPWHWRRRSALGRRWRRPC